MTSLLELKEKVIRFYGKNEAYIAPLMKFIIAFLIFVFINTNIGYMKSISKSADSTDFGTGLLGAADERNNLSGICGDTGRYVCAVA